MMNVKLNHGGFIVESIEKPGADCKYLSFKYKSDKLIVLNGSEMVRAKDYEVFVKKNIVLGLDCMIEDLKTVRKQMRKRILTKKIKKLIGRFT